MTELENEFIRFWVIDGILHSKFKFEVNMDLDMIQKLIELRHTISNNVNQYWCYDITSLKSISKEGRDEADKYGQDYLFASAVIVNSHITKFMFNTYVRLKSSSFPFQAFTNKEKAVEWLNELKAQRNKANFNF